MNPMLLINFLKVHSAAKANHLSGWIGVAVSGFAAWLLSGGYVEQFRTFVCQASNDDIGLVVLVIGAGASLLNTGTTAALTRKEEAPKKEDEYPTYTGNG